ncbi:hydroxymethylpyrimidine/phosphomethylpyrimidine kinase [Mesorhizobium sp. BAC0120]|uniref:hydroxymethylpyrimidine/phosphomethylpyrimidine kinase n=1 Tax=Mesorhizobium sp. BAC0120 TaxID=3090670 RepID=UPI00298CE233|nr:hydroxymethylpyrimidine/phosphomethylpyrimidine kinase [Mesorhizobium sp. BAC0120]MDW6024312.1 hydroxymethylpyrimidine/phosphomethylpyrimidine kinase [Mesorhizobium sp. BAC0120]
MAGSDGALAMNAEPHVLVIAGTDSSGGAGLSRDIETIAAHGFRSAFAVTAVTVQTHSSVSRIQPMPASLIADQMRAALGADDVKAVKIGMLGTDEAIAAVVSILRDRADIPVVLDPVLVSSSGRPLIAEGAIDALRHDLMPLCRLLTPNLMELAGLTGSTMATDEATACRQGEELSRAAGTAVLVKGGHAAGAEAIDMLLQPGRPALRFAAPRLAREMRGTGCMLSSAIAAGLALGQSLDASVRKAKQYVLERLDCTV